MAYDDSMPANQAQIAAIERKYGRKLTWEEKRILTMGLASQILLEGSDVLCQRYTVASMCHRLPL